MVSVALTKSVSFTSTRFSDPNVTIGGTLAPDAACTLRVIGEPSPRFPSESRRNGVTVSVPFATDAGIAIVSRTAVESLSGLVKTVESLPAKAPLGT